MTSWVMMENLAGTIARMTWISKEIWWGKWMDGINLSMLGYHRIADFFLIYMYIQSHSGTGRAA